MSTRPTTAEIKNAFTQIANAIEDLQIAKLRIIDLHYISEEVDNSAFLVENYHRWESPDSDGHDILFARHEKAKSALTEMYDRRDQDTIENLLKSAEVRLSATRNVL